jgi:hypothetical protein
VLLCGRAEQAAGSAREVPCARAWGFQQNISWERRSDPHPLVYGLRRARPLLLFPSWNGMDWEGATACAVVRVTCWGFYGGNNSFDSSHQIKPNISIAGGRDAASF